MPAEEAISGFGRILENKTAIVTGAGRGIGRAIALAYGAAGARVVLAARGLEALREVEALIRKAGGQAITVKTDVSDPKSAAAMTEEAIRRFGAVDILVNNSGIAGPTANIEEIGFEQWRETLDVNLTGAWLCCRAVVPGMKRRRHGRIVNISSMTGKRPLPQRSPYCASKMGLIGLTRCLAAELGPDNITVNAISPGATEGPRIEQVIENIAKHQSKDPEDVRRGLVAIAPLGRFVKAEEVAAAAVFLASDLARNTTGEDLNVSAGAVMY